MKKVASLLMVVLMVAGLTVGVSAHGHGQGGGGHHRNSTTSAAPRYPRCSVADCHLTGNHYHSGVLYCGHYAGDGHDHNVCNLENCTQAGPHQHGDEVYFCHENCSGGCGAGLGGRYCRRA